jgi:hypothetical protein
LKFVKFDRVHQNGIIRVNLEVGHSSIPVVLYKD